MFVGCTARSGPSTCLPQHLDQGSCCGACEHPAHELFLCLRGCTSRAPPGITLLQTLPASLPLGRPDQDNCQQAKQQFCLCFWAAGEAECQRCSVTSELPAPVCLSFTTGTLRPRQHQHEAHSSSGHSSSSKRLLWVIQDTWAARPRQRPVSGNTPTPDVTLPAPLQVIQHTQQLSPDSPASLGAASSDVIAGDQGQTLTRGAGSLSPQTRGKAGELEGMLSRDLSHPNIVQTYKSVVRPMAV